MIKRIFIFTLLSTLIIFIILNFHSIFFRIIYLQEKVISIMTNLSKQKESNFIYLFMMATFLYGVVHSIGPGHGKTLVMTYSLKEKFNFKKILILSSMIAYFQGISAFLVTKFIVDISTKNGILLFYTLDERSRLVSSVLIILIGIFNIVLLLKAKHNDDNVIEEKKSNIFLFSLALGLCPCPGVMGVLLFFQSLGYSKNIFLLAMCTATGIFTVIFFLAFFTTKVKKIIFKEEKKSINKVLSLLSSTLLIIFGLLQIVIII